MTFHVSPYLLLVLTTLFWSGNFVLGRAVSEHIPPIALSFLLLGHTVHLRQTLGIAASLLGVLVILSRGNLETLLNLEINPGDAWIMAAVLSWAVYSVCLRWRPAGLQPLTLLTAIMGSGLVALVPVYGWDLSRGNLLELDLITFASIVYVALFPSVLAYIFWNRAVAELGANKSGQFMHLMPAAGAILSWLLLGEGLHIFHLIGIGSIALGIFLATVRRHNAEINKLS